MQDCRLTGCKLKPVHLQPVSCVTSTLLPKGPAHADGKDTLSFGLQAHVVHPDLQASGSVAPTTGYGPAAFAQPLRSPGCRPQAGRRRHRSESPGPASHTADGGPALA